MKSIESGLSAYCKTIADALQNVKGIVLGTHEKESQIARQCISSEEHVIGTCLDEITKGDSSLEREARLWDQINNAQNRQERLHAAQVAACRESRGMALAFGAFAVIGIAYVVNPEAGKGLSNALLTKGGKALLS